MTAVRGVTVAGIQDLQVKMRQVDRGMRPMVAKALREGAEMVRGHMVETKLNGNPLKRGEGRLAGGWTVRDVPASGTDIAVAMGTKVKYARVHNYGFHGSVWVKEHLRSPPKGRQERKPSRGAKPKAKVRHSQETKARSLNKKRRNDVTFAAHGTSLSAKQASSRQARRARGTQAGTSAPSGSLLARLADTGPGGGSGMIAVGGHGRFMKIRATYYIGRSLREKEADVARLMRRRLHRLYETGGTQ